MTGNETGGQDFSLKVWTNPRSKVQGASFLNECPQNKHPRTQNKPPTRFKSLSWLWSLVGFGSVSQFRLGAGRVFFCADRFISAEINRPTSIKTCRGAVVRAPTWWFKGRQHGRQFEPHWRITWISRCFRNFVSAKENKGARELTGGKHSEVRGTKEPRCYFGMTMMRSDFLIMEHPCSPPTLPYIRGVMHIAHVLILCQLVGAGLALIPGWETG